eukprot:PhF_6_TR25620/c0_g1_i1/m.35977
MSDGTIASQLLFVVEWLHTHGLTKAEAALLLELEGHPTLRGALRHKPSSEAEDTPSKASFQPSSPKPHNEPVVRLPEPVAPIMFPIEQDDQVVNVLEESPLIVRGITEDIPLLPAQATAPLVVDPSPPQLLRQMVEDVTNGRPPRGDPASFILPSLPPTLDDRDNTWDNDEDIGILPLQCGSSEEEVRELWGYDDDGCLTESPSFPFGAGLSAHQLVAAKKSLAEGIIPPLKDGDDSPVTPNSTPTGSLTVTGGLDNTTKPAPRPAAQAAQLEVFDLKIIYEVGHTGFEENKDFPIVINSLIANRYQVMEYIGSAAFSRAVQCLDLKTGQTVCIKIIRNSKDFFDQSLDEIKLLQYLNTAGDSDDNCVLQLYDYFYYKEHLFLVCELLKDNLYEFSKYNREHADEEFYFTMPRMQKITKSILQALSFIHKLQLIHCDLKPENILIKSYSRCEVKVIDFGSSCYLTDHLSSYIQSRCYRAPEVILGMQYDHRIDVWSLGAILPELITGRVLFHNESVPQMLARIASICGPYPTTMLQTARHAHKYFTKCGVVYERRDDKLVYLYAKPTTLRHRLGKDVDPLFLDFVQKCLILNPKQRPSASELLSHPFILHDYGEVTPSS